MPTMLEVVRSRRYDHFMIKSFRGKYAEQLYQRKFVKRFSVIERQALTRLRRLDAAT